MEFTEEETKILEQYVSSIDSNIFVLRNLPEVMKGALFSRYSRSTLGLRELFLKEFALDSTEKAQSFYDRILDGYGDDSIAELGGAHLAIEKVSMIGTKILEDCRIGGSPLEKSTRYVYFDQKEDGHYQFYQEPTLMNSQYRDLYMNTCNRLFEIYSELSSKLTPIMQEKFPKQPDSSQNAYNAALRARVLDCVRGLLPAATLTNMGMLGNGRFFETMLQKLNSEPLAEMKEISKTAYKELAKEIPSFIRRSEEGHRHQIAFHNYQESTRKNLQQIADKMEIKRLDQDLPRVSLVDFDKDALKKVASALIYSYTDHSMQEIMESLSQEEMAKIVEIACENRKNRRHKSPRALENAYFTFEIVADFGVYRDLQRHRMLTQERQKLSCSLGYYIPQEIVGTSMESLYREAMEIARDAHEKIKIDFPDEAQYVVPMAYNIRWYYTINLRALQWLCELRSSPQGHEGYRYVAQEMAHLVSKSVPQFSSCFAFVDYEGHYALGRLEQEERKERQRALL